jgi:Fur family zinc uptake transcriptional regulator
MPRFNGCGQARQNIRNGIFPSACQVRYSRGMGKAMSLHDHSRCCGHPVLTLDERLKEASRVCARRGSRLTDQRGLVLSTLIESGRALGAYDLIERVAIKAGRRIAPISIYRILDFLIDAHLVHRIESRNAFVACPGGHGQHAQAVFLICDGCGAITETLSPSLEAALARLAADAGFAVTGRMVEVTGRCRACTDLEGASHP